MVKRVFGRVDGQEVELSADSGDRWSVPVPFDADGEYVVEILAEDDAGNQAYMAKMLFVVNTALLCAHVEPLPSYGQLIDVLPDADVLPQRVYADFCGCLNAADIIPFGYYAELVDPACAERR